MYAVNAEDIEYILLRWTEDSTFSGTFTISPKHFKCTSTFEISDFGRKQKTNAHTNVLQLPISINHATTGHKLQGKTVKSLLIGEWTLKVKNWIYVVLSRVTEIVALYLSEPIPTDAIEPLDDRYLAMMDRLRQTISVKKSSNVISEIRRNLQINPT